MSEKLEGLLTATDIAVVELEELQGLIAESQERGFLAADALAAALEEAELSSQQTHELLSYLEEHGIEILPTGDSGPELHLQGVGTSTHDAAEEDPLAERSPEQVLEGVDADEQEGDEHVRSLHARLDELKTARS